MLHEPPFCRIFLCDITSLFLLQGYHRLGYLLRMLLSFIRFLSRGLVLSLILASVSLAAGEQNTKWEEFRSFYDTGKYQEAIQSLKRHPSNDANYFYNLGNTYYRLGQFGLATAYLEKSNRTRAHDPDIQQNLSLAKAALSKQIGEDRIDPASGWIESISDNAPLDEIRGILGLFAFVLTLLWIRSYYKSRSLKRTLLQPAGLLGLLALAITASLYLIQRLNASSPPAVAVTAESIRSGPGEQFIELTRIEPGMKIRLLEKSAKSGDEAWQQIRYSKSSIGWIKESSLLPL
ncbi:MAG: hypothetical protein A3K03_03895 [Bdellovibrionales bacterium RIFOXYD1_FULL_44_7]|nr:MAG: hypothetical protein A3K03_03895 [Bdellovibrionales bacterium RIFOXYD1_FULL_44_7]